MIIKSKVFIQKDPKQFEGWNFRVIMNSFNRIYQTWIQTTNIIIIKFKIKMRNSFIFRMVRLGTYI